MAPTCACLETNIALAIVPREASHEKAKQTFPAYQDPYKAQLEAYKVMDDGDLFVLKPVRVNVRPEDLPGRPRSRVICEQCGEGINDGRERRVKGRILCRHCAGESYYEEISDR